MNAVVKFLKILPVVFIVLQTSESIAQNSGTFRLGVEDNYIFWADSINKVKQIPCLCFRQDSRNCFLYEVHITNIVQIGDSSVYSLEALGEVKFLLVNKSMQKLIPKSGKGQVIATNSDSSSILKLVDIFEENKYTKEMIFEYPEGHFTGLIRCQTYVKRKCRK